MSNYKEFGPDYFADGNMTDPLRLSQFQSEKKYLQKFTGTELIQSGKILDIGCSTGEFLESINWNIGGRYGIEISDYAKRIAETRGINFDKSLDEINFFDIIVLRGTIQYLLNPFEEADSSSKCNS